MKLLSLLEHLEYKRLQGSTEQEVTSVVYDSRKVDEGSLFICIRGAVVDGHKFVPDVIAKGAKTLIVEEPIEAPADVPVIYFRSMVRTSGREAENYRNHRNQGKNNNNIHGEIYS